MEKIISEWREPKMEEKKKKREKAPNTGRAPNNCGNAPMAEKWRNAPK